MRFQHVCVEALYLCVFGRFIGIADRHFGRLCAVFCGQRIGVGGDIGGIHPRHPRVFDTEIAHLVLDHGHPVGRALRRHRVGGIGSCSRGCSILSRSRSGRSDGQGRERGTKQFHRVDPHGEIQVTSATGLHRPPRLIKRSWPAIPRSLLPARPWSRCPCGCPVLRHIRRWEAARQALRPNRCRGPRRRTPPAWAW